MRTKKISLLLALVLVISAIALPLTAYAAGDKDTTPPELAASLDGDTLKIESSDDHSGVEAVFVDGNRINSLTNGAASVTLKDYAGTGKQVSVYAQDYAGNRSKTVKFENPYYEEPAPTEKPASIVPQNQNSTPVKPAQAQATSSGSTNHNAQTSNSGSNASGNGSNAGTNTGTNGGSNTASGTNNGSSNSQGEAGNTSSIPEGAFTPEGTGTVQDNISGEDGDKQFYTITTEAGNVFYLIIDSKRDDNNVYFLNGVTEADLMALTEKNEGTMSVIPAEDICACTDKCAAGEVNTACPVCKNDLKGCAGKEKPAETEEPAQTEPPKKDNGSAGTIIFIIVALLAVGGVGYYVKIVRPKQQAEDDGDFEDVGYGEGFDPDEAYGEPEYLSEDDFDDRINKEQEDSE